MGMIFEKPPLLEIIAELRWAAVASGGAAVQGHPLPVMPDRIAPFDQAFMQFTAKLGALGYERVERLVPYGFPLLPYEPALRLRPKPGVEDATLIQIGPNLFTANAVPPYRSWEDFAPKVKAGVEALLDTRIEQDAGADVRVSLRYIDAFGEDLMGGRSMIAFLTEVLGIRLALHPAIAGQCAPGQEILPGLQLQVPLAFGTMTVAFGAGQVEQRPAILMDTTVALAEAVPPEVERIMTGFEQARAVIHTTFMQLTQPIHALMKPLTEIEP